MKKILAIVILPVLCIYISGLTSCKSKSAKQEQKKIEPSGQTTERQLTGESVIVASTPVAEDRTVAEKKPAEAQALSPESSIEPFVEKWRRSWEEGDLQTYIGCYHPDFRARGMNILAWKNYKQDLFNRTPERDIKISDISFELNGTLATVTFKQRYKTNNYNGFGLKTFQLTNYEGNWAILEESYDSLPAVVEPVEVAIQSFVEKWRLAWEEGDLESYTDCYHPGFKTEKLDLQEWKIYKQDLFRRSEKRNIQISDMQIEPNGASAVVTFKQSYQTAKNRDVGLKTLHLRRHQDSWTIFKENWQPLSGQG